MKRSLGTDRRYSYAETFGVGGVRFEAEWKLWYDADSKELSAALELSPVDGSQMIVKPIDLSEVPYHVLEEIDSALDEDRLDIGNELTDRRTVSDDG